MEVEVYERGMDLMAASIVDAVLIRYRLQITSTLPFRQNLSRHKTINFSGLSCESIPNSRRVIGDFVAASKYLRMISAYPSFFFSSSSRHGSMAQTPRDSL
jgi:hypothetical protein